MSMLKVGFVLCSRVENPMPSTRIAVLNMLPYLRDAGIQPIILFEPLHPSETPDLTGVAERATASDCAVVVMQKVHGPSALALAGQLTMAGVRTVFVCCDLVEVTMVEATDATVIVTEYLKALYPIELQSRIHVVHDGIEQPTLFKSDWGTARGSSFDPLKAILVTSAHLDHVPVFDRPPNWLKLRIIGQYARGFKKWNEIRWKWMLKPPDDRLSYWRFLVDRRVECLPWEARGVYQQMMLSHIGIIPIDTSAIGQNRTLPPSWKVKSENRLTMKMSIGLPVVATPIPAYESIIEHGVNGFFARSKQDWASCLSELRDPARRREIGLAARLTVSGKYSLKNQALKLVSILRSMPTHMSLPSH